MGDRHICKATRDTLEQIGVNLESGHCVLNALDECGYKHFPEITKDLIAWRDVIIEEAKKRNT